MHTQQFLFKVFALVLRNESLHNFQLEENSIKEDFCAHTGSHLLELSCCATGPDVIMQLYELLL